MQTFQMQDALTTRSDSNCYPSIYTRNSWLEIIGDTGSSFVMRMAWRGMTERYATGRTTRLFETTMLTLVRIARLVMIGAQFK